VIPSLAALGRRLRRAPVSPASVAAVLAGHEAFLAFRQVVQELFPDAADEILAAGASVRERESARVWAFLRRVEEEFFPTYDLDEYEQVLAGIPFVRNGWSYERFHEVDLRTGELLLFALCAQPYDSGADTRVALLDAAEAHVPRELLLAIPEGGLSPAELHARLDDTPYAAAALYADWLWGEAGTAFLDLDDEMEVSDADWTPEVVQELAAQWQEARAILDRIGELATRLEADPPEQFGRLLAAVGGEDPHLVYERTRRFYACELTEAGLVAHPPVEPEPIAVSPEPAP
jgi:hypothetical protein